MAKSIRKGGSGNEAAEGRPNEGVPLSRLRGGAIRRQTAGHDAAGAYKAHVVPVVQSRHGPRTDRRRTPQTIDGGMKSG